MTKPVGAPGARTSPLRAALLSFLWPGLGHLALRDRRAAAIFAAPLLALAAWVAFLVATRGIDGFAIMLIDPAVALALVWVVVVTGIWRLVAVADAFRRAGGATGRRVVTGFGMVVVVAAIIAPHALGTWYAWSLYDAGVTIFSGDVLPTPARGSSTGPGGSADPSGGAIGSPTTEPSFAPVSPTRFTVLLTGIDSGPGRNHALTDTLIVVSVDRSTGKTAMVSFPRDLAYFPLYDGGTYAGRINSLRNWADANPARYPDGGWATLARELGFLLGIPVPFYAAVDLAGFEQMINAVGGVTVNNPKAIDDPSYGGWTDNRPVGFHLSAGVHELDGATALAFVRSRKGNGDNDFTRARRQQQLLVAVGRKLSDPAMFPRLPAILSAAKQTVRTNVPPDELQQLLDVANSVKNDSIRSVVLGPPYAEKVNVASIYLLQFVPGMLEQVSIDLFGSESRYAPPAPVATPAPS
jgi:LCP family protein required for cell wall assembly